MASMNHLVGVDMNNQINLNLYSQLLLFNIDLAREEFLLIGQGNSEQRTLQALAHSLDLEFEYHLSTKTIRISRATEAPCAAEEPQNFDINQLPTCPDPNDIFPNEDYSFWNSDFGQNGSSMEREHQDLAAPTAQSHPQSVVPSTHHIASPLPSRNFVPARLQEVLPHDIAPNLLSNGHLPRKFCKGCQTYVTQSCSEYCDVCANNQPPCDNSGPQCTHCGGECSRKDSLSDIIFCEVYRNGGDAGDPLSILPPNESLISPAINDSDLTKKNNANRSPSSTNPAGGLALIDKTWDDSPSLANGDKWKRYQCDRCQNTYSRKILLRIHQMSHGPMSDCPNRTQTFITARSLQEHQNQHPDKSTADNIPLQRCPNASGGGFLDLRTSALDDQISHLGSPCSKPASVNSGASTGYQEYVFDSKSAHSSFGSCASGVSATSRASGRRGPLSDWARTGMNTLKAVGGACWRCKFLRKSCSPETPCRPCPSNAESSSWAALGCQRGPFKIKKLDLCPLAFPVEEEPSIEETNAAEDSNDVHSLLNYLESGRYGISWLYEENDAKFKEKDEVFASRAIAARKLILEEISKAHDLAGYPLSASDLSPVKEGVLTAVWEILHCDPTCGILDNNILSDERGNFGCLARLLSSAAVCQANTKSNQLIAQSVICLRTCAQALRAKQANLLERHWHQECSPRCCRFECIATINMHLRLYMKELSRVFFNKDNMRNPHVWWLSTFYSFCIQSIIRKALIDLTSCSSTIQHWDGFSARQYLHLPIRLFIASTAALDIVNSKDGFSYVCFPKNAYVVPHKNEIFGLMLAVEQPKWEGNNITCTSMYLNRLFGFEDDGRYITFDYRSEENKVWKEIFHGRSETLPLAALQEYQNSFGHVKADSKFICGEEGCRKRYPTRLHLFRHLIQHTSGQVLDCERPHCTLDSGDRAQHWLNHNPLYTLKCRYADQTFHFSLQDVYLFNKRIWRQLWMDGKDPDPVWISDTFRAAEGGFGSYSSDDNDRRRPAKKAKKRAKTKLWGSSFQNVSDDLGLEPVRNTN